MGATPPARSAISCVVADDSPDLVERIAELLSERGFDVVGRATDVEAALAAVEAHKPAVAVLSPLVPRVSAIEVAKLVRARSPATATVLYTASDVAESLVEGFGDGIQGLVKREAPLERLVDAIEHAAVGALYLDPDLVPALILGVVGKGDVDLSERERDVLHLLADGKTNDEIGRTLHISADTVRTYVSRAMQKLEADNRTHAVAIALRRSFID